MAQNRLRTAHILDTFDHQTQIPRHMKHTLQNSAKRLLQYSAASLSFCGIQQADAQMVYTDIDPDTVLAFTGPDDFLLDLNNDGIDDFNIIVTTMVTSFTTSSGVSSYTTYAMKIYPLNENEVLVNGGDAEALFPGAWIDEDGDEYGIFTPDSAYVVGSNSIIPKYIGLKLVNDGETYYGWMRLKNVLFDKYSILDYAIESTPDTPIYTQIPTGPIGVTDIVLQDVSDTHTVADLQVSFTIPSDESHISAYRIFAGQLSFETFSAVAALPTQYTEVFPTGSNQVVTLDADQLDRWGFDIEEFDLLSVSVLSVGFGDPYEHILKYADEQIILGHKLQAPLIVDVATEPAATPVNGIQTTFYTPENMEGIINFFSFVVPSADLLGLDTSSLCDNANHVVLNDWEVPGEAFESFTEYAINIPSNDINGNPITFDQTYHVCVLSHSSLDDYTGCLFENLTCSGGFVPEEILKDAISEQTSSINVTMSNQGIHVQTEAMQGELLLYNISGQLVHTQTITGRESIIQLPEFSGWYTVILVSDKGIMAQPILVIK